MNESLTRIDALRLEALNQAINSRNSSSTTNTIVDRAKQFEEYLLQDDGKDQDGDTSSAEDDANLSEKQYVAIKMAPGGVMIAKMPSTNSKIPEGFLQPGETAFVVESFDWASWYDNN